jgi:uncharacterized membrane protein YjfL (UPF0719 family)
LRDPDLERVVGEDEILLSIVSTVLGVWFLGAIYVRLAVAMPLGSRPPLRRGLALVPPLALLGIFWVLRNLASFDVREDPGYLWQYLAFGAAWVGIGLRGFDALAVSWRDDVIERNNEAAFWVVAGAALGLTAAYAGANVGDGPSWLVVAYAASLATLLLLAAWWVVDRLTLATDHVIAGRDAATGLRIGALLCACGLIAGRAAAGDWFDALRTLRELTLAWPILALVALEVGTAWSGPRGRPYARGLSLTLALVYLAIAVATIVLSPPPAENPIYGS